MAMFASRGAHRASCVMGAMCIWLLSRIMKVTEQQERQQ